MFEQLKQKEESDRFSTMLHDETWCIEYLYYLKWPEGFSCPCCSNPGKLLSPRRKIVCQECGHSVSITSGTLLHGTKKSLSQWLRALWFFYSEEGKKNTRRFQKYLTIKNYQTAWNWTKKLRSAIESVNCQKCSGTVEITDFAVNNHEFKFKNCHILAAIEVSMRQESTGRLRMNFYRELNQEIIQLFIKKNIAEGCIVILPDTPQYNINLSPDFFCVTEPRLLFPEKAKELINQFVSTYYGHKTNISSLQKLENNLNEFCFHQNNKLFSNSIAGFENFVTMVLAHKPLKKGS